MLNTKMVMKTLYGLKIFIDHTLNATTYPIMQQTKPQTPSCTFNVRLSCKSTVGFLLRTDFRRTVSIFFSLGAYFSSNKHPKLVRDLFDLEGRGL